MKELVTKDWLVFIFYFLIVALYGVWVYFRKRKKEADTHSFFLAEGQLAWWAIGASLIASNISAEQFIGMSGNGFTVGIAISAYEWIAALSLVIVAVFFMPIYLKNRIYTMPQFLKTRYNETVSLIMAIFWLFLYIFINLTSILYLGALAIDNLGGGGHFHLIILLLAAFALVITLGGMKVIGYTDVIQVAVLIVGGLATTYLALTVVSDKLGLGGGALAGLHALMDKAGDHFHMILDKPGPGAQQYDVNRYLIVPGIAMYFAGQWIVNLNYWGCNQYITQRALGADLKTARTGILFAAFLKLLMPVIVMLPGIAAFVLHENGHLQSEMADATGKVMADKAYSAVLGFLPAGLKGLSLAALTAAIVASLAGKANSISTIYTLDIHKKYFDKAASEQKMVWIGRVVIIVAMLLSIALTWNDLLGVGRSGGFTFIQKYTGYISPGVFAIFMLGMFWKRTTGPAAVAGILVGFGSSVFFNDFAAKIFGRETMLYTAFTNADGVLEIPFLICMGWAFVFAIIVMVAMSLAGPRVNAKAFELDGSMFKLTPRLAGMVAVILLVLSVLYVKFW